VSKGNGPDAGDAEAAFWGCVSGGSPARFNKLLAGNSFPQNPANNRGVLICLMSGTRRQPKPMFKLYCRASLEGSLMERRSFMNQIPFEERLACQAHRLRDEANKLSPGSERDDLIRKARQAETASHLTEWLTSPGLACPSECIPRL
jgi:hypothetical protein